MYFIAGKEDTANRVNVYAGDKQLSLIHKKTFVSEQGSGFTAGVFKLNEGDGIYLQVVGFDTIIWVGSSTSFFGAYLI